MNKTFKRILALALAGAMLLSFAACAPKDKAPTGGEQVSSDGDTWFSEPVPIEIMVSSHISWPYNEDWAIWKIIREKMGADLTINAVPSSDIGTKLPLMLANPDELPDLLYSIAGTKTIGDDNGPLGAFVAINKYEDKMPNYKAFWDSVPDKDEYMISHTSGDGNIYLPPMYGSEGYGSEKTWMYRKDIFEKHGLAVPTTMDELYDVCKKLKEIYPESYPLCLRTGIHFIDGTGVEWKKFMNYHLSYDYDNDKWMFGVLEPEFKEMIAFYSKMISEGMIPVDFMTIPVKTWEELMSTDRGFISMDYGTRIDQFNMDVRQSNPEYTWTAMEPPVNDESKGERKVLKPFKQLNGYMIFNTGDQTRIDNSLKFLDWFYSPEGIEITSWGVEGVSYETVDGKKQYITPADGTDISNAYGLYTPGAYMCVDPEAYSMQYSPEQREQTKQLQSYQTANASPFFTMAFPDDVATERADIWVAINGLCGEMLSKFLLGQRPMDEWDDFVQDLKDLGTDRLLEIYTETYKSMAE